MLQARQKDEEDQCTHSAFHVQVRFVNMVYSALMTPGFQRLKR